VHNLNTSTPWVSCYDGSGNMVGSTGASTAITSVVANSANQATITFSGSTTATCAISSGVMGPVGPAGANGTNGTNGTNGANGAGYTATSSTSLTIGTGAQSLTTQTGLAYAVGGCLQIISAGAPSSYMIGPITAYNSTTGALTFSSTAQASGTCSGTGGSGAHTDWNLSIAGVSGANGTGVGDVIAAGNNTYTGSNDFSGATATLPIEVGLYAGLPGTCKVGQMYFASDGINGRNLLKCQSTNAWSTIVYDQGPALPAICVTGQVFFRTGGTAGQNWYGCTTTNTWTLQGDGGNYQTMQGAGPLGASANNTDRTQRVKMQGRDNLSFDDDGTNTIMNFTTLDARVMNLYDEFVAGTTSGAIGALNWSAIQLNGTNTVTMATDAWPNAGILRLTAGSSTPAQGNAIALDLNGSNGTNGPLTDLYSNTNWGMMFIFRINSTSNMRFRLGIAQSTAAGGSIDASKFAGIRFDTNTSFGDSTNFIYYAKNGSAATATATGPAVDTNFHTLLIYSTTAGVVHVQMDGGTDKTFCAAGGGCDGSITWSTGFQLQPIVICGTDTASSQTCDVDQFAFKMRLSTATANKRN
jgi:hypothetical protein